MLRIKQKMNVIKNKINDIIKLNVIAFRINYKYKFNIYLLWVLFICIISSILIRT